ncbi:hypothetical protein [Celeribacter baekdonensis]|uniref:hypothetical protein n=1 Tax=Celeribacter baekdonensis TaxID=875171 RepID=UPI003A9232C1
MRLLNPEHANARNALIQHDPSDVYLVEICSRKVVRLGNWVLQLNYFQNSYAEFFSDRMRASTFWRQASSGDQAEMDAFLGECWSATAQMQEDCETLRQIRMSYSTIPEITRDVAWLMQTLPEVVFITHIDAARPDGQTIASRSEMIRLVENIVTQLRGRVFNPTPLMHEFGQEQAIEDSSTSLAHYQHDFSTQLVHRWIEHELGAAMITAATLSRKDETLILDHIQHREAAKATKNLDVLMEWVAMNRPDWHGVLEWRLQRALAQEQQDEVRNILNRVSLELLSTTERTNLAEICATFGAGHMFHALVSEGGKTDPAQEAANSSLALPSSGAFYEILRATQNAQNEGDGARALETLLTYLSTTDTLDALAQSELSPLFVTLIEAQLHDFGTDTLTRVIETTQRHALSPATLQHAKKAYRNSVVPKIKALEQDGDLAGLLDLQRSAKNIDGLIPELYRAIAGVSMAQKDLDTQLWAAGKALENTPTDRIMARVAMRAAFGLEYYLDVPTYCQMILQSDETATDRPAEEARLRLQQLPAKCLKAAREADDMVQELKLYRAAAESPDLRERCISKIRALEIKLISKSRQALAAEEERAYEAAEEVSLLIGPNEILLRSMGRYLVKQRRFSDAFGVWETLTKMVPNSDAYRFEYDRCIAKVGSPI